MATKSTEERFEDLMREYARQTEQWARAKAKLDALGDARIRLPRSLLAKLDEVCRRPVLN